MVFENRFAFDRTIRPRAVSRCPCCPQRDREAPVSNSSCSRAQSQLMRVYRFAQNAAALKVDASLVAILSVASLTGTSTRDPAGHRPQKHTSLRQSPQISSVTDRSSQKCAASGGNGVRQPECLNGHHRRIAQSQHAHPASQRLTFWCGDKCDVVVAHDSCHRGCPLDWVHNQCWLEPSSPTG